MNDDISKMVRKVELEVGFKWCVNLIELERFAALVAEKEREACAKVCDDWAKTSYLSEAKSCAKIIRARGNT